MIASAILVTLLLFGLLVLGLPVAFALLIAASIGILTTFGADMLAGAVQVKLHEGISSYTLSAIPTFILMAEILTAGRFTRDLFHACQVWMGHIKGGLSYAAIIGGVLVAAVSGSSSAATGTLAGSICPEMKRHGYRDSFATSTVATVGTLAVLIPPSIGLILFGAFTNTSIAGLLIAGILPGLLTAAGYFLAIRLQLWRDPSVAPTPVEPTPVSERLQSLSTSWPVLVIFVAIFVTIYSGVATPTEVGALGAMVALVIALSFRRLTVDSLLGAIQGATVSTAMLFFIIAASSVFSLFLTLTRAPQELLSFVQTAEINAGLILMSVIAVLFVLGFFMSQLAIFVLTLPLVFPVLTELSYHPIWLGIIYLKVAELGLITPPLGLNCFVVAGVTKVPVSETFKGVWWFVLADLLVLGVLILFPEITLVLPRLAGHA